MKKKDVADTAIVRTSGSLATQQDEIPGYLREYIGDRTGKENITVEDTVVPRLGLAQALSPQLKKSKDVYIDGLEVGHLFDTVTSEIYGREVTVIPLWFEKNYIDFKPIDEGGGINAMYARLEDVPAGGLEWGENGEKPKVTTFANFMCLLSRPQRAPKAIYVSFKSTGIKRTAKKWIGLIQEKDLPMFAFVYHLEVVTNSKGDQEWEGLKVSRVEYTPPEFITAAKKFIEELRAKGAVIDTRGLDEDVDIKSAAEPEQNIPF